MIEKRYLLSGFGRTVINLGKAGEAGATCVLVDVSEWLAAYPNAAVKLFVTPPAPHEPYFADVTLENKVVKWELWEADTAVAGNGSLELLLMDGDRLIKSVTARTTMTSSPSQEKPAGDKPQASPTWWKEALHQIEDAKKAAISEIDGTFAAEVAEGKAALEASGAAQQSAIENKGKNTLDGIPEDWTALDADVRLLKQHKAPAIEVEASGSIVTVGDAAAMPVHGLVSQIVPYQEGTGDPSPDNVRPISGWDSVYVATNGKNLMPIKGVSSELNGVTFTANSDGSVTANGTATANTWYMGLPFTLGKGRKYVLNGCPTGGSAVKYALQIYKAKEDGSSDGLYSEEFGKGTSFTPPITRKYIVSIVIRSGYTAENLTFYPMVRFKKDDAVYEPYSGSNQLTANLPGTVCGGKMDWGTGALTSDRVIETVTSESDLMIENVGALWRVRINGQFNNGVPISDSAKNSYISSHFKTVANSTDNVPWSVCGGSIGYKRMWLYIPMDVCATKEDVLGWFDTQNANGSPVQVSYRVAQATAIQLTPQKLDMLRGTNNVWSDCGDTSMVYVADTKMYTDKQIAAAVALALNG